MLLKSALMVTMSSLLACFAWGEQCNEKCHDKCIVAQPCFDRLVVLQRDTFAPLNQFPVDPLHTKMINSHLYTPQQAQQNTNDAIADFYQKTGIDVSDNNPLVVFDKTTGFRTIPNLVLFVPSALFDDQRLVVAFDSQNSERGKPDNQWYVVEYGNHVLFTGPWVVPDGFLLAGASIATNDVYLYADLNFLQCASNFEEPCSREVVHLRCFQVSKAFNTQWGPLVYGDAIHAIDSFGNVGLYMGGNQVIKDIFTTGGLKAAPDISRISLVLLWPVVTPPQSPTFPPTSP